MKANGWLMKKWHQCSLKWLKAQWPMKQKAVKEVAERKLA